MARLPKKVASERKSEENRKKKKLEESSVEEKKSEESEESSVEEEKIVHAKVYLKPECKSYRKHGMKYLPNKVFHIEGEDAFQYYSSDGHFEVLIQK